MNGRIVGVLAAAAVLLAGCTPAAPTQTPAAPVTCRLDTEFMGWVRDPGPPPWDYLALCDGRPYHLLYPADGHGCPEAKPGALVQLSISRVVSSDGGSVWSCEPITMGADR